MYVRVCVSLVPSVVTIFYIEMDCPIYGILYHINYRKILVYQILTQSCDENDIESKPKI